MPFSHYCRQIKFDTKRLGFSQSTFCSSAINEDINRLLVNNVDLRFVYTVKTHWKRKLVFSTNYSDHLQYRQGIYYLNQQKMSNQNHLIFRLSQKDILIYNSDAVPTEINLFTSIDISFHAVKYPEASGLWGNEPRITLKYQIQQ